MRTGLLLLAAVLLAAGAVLAHGSGPGGPDAPTRDVQHAPVEGADLVAQPTLVGVARGPRVTPAAGIDEGGCVEPEPAPAPPLHLTVHVCHAERRWRAAFVGSGESIAVPDREVFSRLRLAPDLPAGFVTLHEPEVVFRRAAEARRYVVVVPVVQEAVLEVRATRPDGRPAENVLIRRIRLHGSEVESTEVESAAPGVLRVRGLPRLPGERVDLVIDFPEPQPDEPEARSKEMRVYGRLHALHIPSDIAPWVLAVRDGPGPEGHVTSPGLDTDCCMDMGEPTTHEKPALGNVRLRFVDHLGRALTGTHDQEGFMDEPIEAGMLLREDVPSGRSRQSVAIEGHLPFEGMVEVQADATVEAVLHEPQGGRLDVAVEDELGRALPHARLACRSARWLDVVDGVARVDAVTDEAGRRTLARVQPGTFLLLADWGGRGVEREVTVRDGETTTVTLVAR